MTWHIEEHNTNLYHPTCYEVESISALVELLREFAVNAPGVYSLEVSPTVTLHLGLRGEVALVEQFDWETGQGVTAHLASPIVPQAQRFKSRDSIIEVPPEYLFPLNEAIDVVCQSCVHGRLPENVRRKTSPTFQEIESG